ncbi:MAG: endopolygalacturonase [Clostridia bacterium]|nr:endopolygalacturonase [Clostridia bacterium]
MQGFQNVRALGAFGDGLHDDAAVLNRLIRSGQKKLFLPCGHYLLRGTLLLESGTEILADENACLQLAPGAQKGRRDFLAANGCAAEHIRIRGGVWDGNSAQNSRGADLFDPAATSGALFSFRGVKHLSLTDMKLKNPLCYYLRFCEAEDVLLENLVFESEDLHINQDGVHLAGFCRRFTIRNLRGVNGSPGDDYIALNADDCLTRQESFDMINGLQSEILIENIHADECHCFVRLLSVASPIERVTIRNITGCCRGTAINMDAARHCRVPLFRPGDEIAENGVGHLKNVRIENVRVGRKQATDEPFIAAETNAERLEIRDFQVLSPSGGPVVAISDLAPHRVLYQRGQTSLDESLPPRARRAFTDPAFDTLILEITD